MSRHSAMHHLGIYHGTDKHNSEHTFAGESYLDVYHNILKDRRDVPNQTIVEIGVFNGASIRTMRDYFHPTCNFIGVDINPNSKNVESARFNVIIGSQVSPDTIQELKESTPDGIDLLVDDGSHLVDHMLQTFDMVFPHIKSGGWYIIEDTGNTYRDLTNDVKGWHGMEYNDPETTNYNHERQDIDKFILDHVHNIDSKIGSVRELRVYNQMIAIKKV